MFLCHREYEQEPRFASPSSLEHAVATQWKMAYESEKRQREELEQHLRQARNSLVNEMESIKEQHQTELLRQELAHHQQEQLRLVQQLRMRQGNLASLPSGAGGGLLEPSVSVGGGMPSLFPSPPTERPPVPEVSPVDYFDHLFQLVTLLGHQYQLLDHQYQLVTVLDHQYQLVTVLDHQYQLVTVLDHQYQLVTTSTS